MSQVNSSEPAAAPAQAAPAPAAPAAPVESKIVWSKAAPAKEEGAAPAKAPVESWPSLGDYKRVPETKAPRAASPRRKKSEDDAKDSKGKGKWVPFPEPVPVAPREDATHQANGDGHRGDHSRPRGGGPRRGGARGGMGGRGAHHGPRSEGHHHPRRNPEHDAAGAGDAGQVPSAGQGAAYYPDYGYAQQYPSTYAYYYETLYMVQQQIEYYFSDENLARDMYLRSQLSPEGWIPVEVIATFRRLATLLVGMLPPETFNFIAMALQNSTIVEFVDGRLRRRLAAALSTDAPEFVPLANAEASSTASAAPALITEAQLVAEAPAPVSAGSTATPVPAPAASLAPASPVVHAKASPRPARSPAVASAASGRARAISAPRSPALAHKDEWTAVGVGKRTAKGTKQAGKDTRKPQAHEHVDDEMEFMFDEEAVTRPGAKAPQKHSAVADDAEHSDEEDDEELPDEEFENIVVLVQTPDSRGKKSDAPRDRTGLPNPKAKAEFAGHIHDELGDFNDGINHIQRSGSFSKTAVVNRAEFDAQRAASGMSPTALLMQAAPKLPAALGSSPLGGLSKSPARAIPLSRSPVGGIAPAADGQKRFFPTPVKETMKKTPYKSKYGSNPVAESGVGWIKMMRPPRASPAPGSLAASLDPSTGMPKARQIATDLISSQGLVEQKYRKFLNECLADREAKGPGKSDLMSALFRFWSFFLRNNFNRSVYEEFKKLARADSSAGFSYGMECLYRFYSYGLEKSFRRGPFEDFQKYVLEDFKTGNLYGLEKFWAFLKYRKDKRPVKASDELEAALKNFKTLDDFHAFGSRACNVDSPAPAAAAAAGAAVAAGPAAAAPAHASTLPAAVGSAAAPAPVAH